MKNSAKIGLFLSIFTLTACSIPPLDSSISSLASLSSTSEEISSSSSEESSNHSGESSNISESISSIEDNTFDLDFYAINDLHGRITSSSYREPGISKIKTHLDNLKAKNEDGFIFLNSGDLWQDTYESMMNKGECLTKAMDLMGCEALTLGNHEFDWGIDNIKYNRSIAGDVTFLGANIFNYDENLNQITAHADDICDSYKIITRGNTKIGIIGIIGKDQITSITSSIWENLSFVDPTNLVKNISHDLKVNQGCDLVVLSSHASIYGNESMFEEFAQIDNATNRPYIDLGFCAHSHRNECEVFNGVPFLQGYCHGEMMSHINIKFDGYNYTYSYQNSYFDNTLASDEEMDELINSYLTPEFIEDKNVIVGSFSNVNGSSISRTYAGRLLAYATYEKLSSDYDIDVVINNGGRNSLYFVGNNQVSKEGVFNALPFTNYTYIAEVQGKDIYNECVDYTNPYYAPNPINVTYYDTTIYRVAVIDYLLLHKSTSRRYNYFSTYSGTPLYIDDQYSYELMWDYLKNNSPFNFNVLYGDEFANINS